jgi:[protein-PII] uridylyltransferase
LLAVEQFMQLYYRHTGGLHEIAMRFVERCRRGSWLNRFARLLPSATVDGCFVVTGSSLTVPMEARSRVLESPARLLRLFELAQVRRLRIDTNLLEEIHRHVEALSAEAFRTSEVSQIFLKILTGPGTSETLESMHRARLLEKLIPVFASVRGLMQFNQYHKYTVDEHSLLAVAKAESLTGEPGLLQQVYGEINRKDILHLALLLHDLGKGREEDHSDVGKAIAEDTAARLGLNEHETHTLVFLVHRHLLMAHTAFRRDPYDEKVLLTFARTVGSPEVLRKLLILTAADIAAVGPGMLTKWKESLLIELYLRTLPELSGERDTASEPERLAQVAHEVAAILERSHGSARSWTVGQVETELKRFPIRYVYGTTVNRIAAHLDALRHLPNGGVTVQYAFNEQLGVTEYTVLTFNDVAPGLFSKIAGVLAAKGLQILDAQIVTREDGVVVDTFQVTDPDYAGCPPAERRSSISTAIEAVLKGGESVESLVARHTRLPVARPFPATGQGTEVQVDNETSDRFTIIDVFADDRQGLLYVITRAIFRLGLSVHAARISTRLDQVADVFYVTNLEGTRPEDPARLASICDTIKEEIDRFLQQGVGEQEGVSSRLS